MERFAGFLTRTPRRQRRAWRALGVVILGVVILVVVILAISLAPGRSSHFDLRVRPATTPTWLDPPAYPPTVKPPTAAAPVLPTDRAVGRAALAYQPARDGPSYLVMPDGTHYQLDTLPQLSPDGRWLVSYDGHIRVRDLMGTRVVERPSYGLPMWSTDSRRILRHTMDGMIITDLAGIAKDVGVLAVPMVGGTPAIPMGMLSSGVVLGVARGTDQRVVLYPSDPLTHRSRPELTVDASAYLRTKETIFWSWTFNGIPGGCQGSNPYISAGWMDLVVFGVFQQPRATECEGPRRRIPTGAVVVSSVDGHVVGRVDLPPTAGLPFLDGQHIVYANQAGPTSAITIEQIDLGGGAARVICRLPATAVLSLRGPG